MSEQADVDITDYRFGRTRFALGIATAAAICKPKLWLGRRRHDNTCDECGEFCSAYAMDQLDFPVDDLDAGSRSTRENVRVMLDAEYRRFCLDCGHGKQQEAEQ